MKDLELHEGGMEHRGEHMTPDKVEEIVDVAFQSVMADIGRHYKVSDRLSDILSDSLSKHLPLALTQYHQDIMREVIKVRNEEDQSDYNKGIVDGQNIIRTLLESKN